MKAEVQAGGVDDEYRFLHFPADAVRVDPMEFARLPESAQRIFEAVRDLGPVTHATLREKTGMPPRTIRFAVKRLRDEEFLDARSSLRDCRTCYFFIHARCVDESALERMRSQAEAAAEREDLTLESMAEPVVRRS